MSEANEDLGTLRRIDGQFEGHLTRHIEHDQQTVWEMLTAPQRLQEWLAPGSIELRVGGAAKLQFHDSGTVIDSTVTACSPPHVIEYSWSGPGEPLRPMRFTATPVAGGTRLDLVIRIPDNEDIGRACAGWEAHLMMLLAAIEGVPIKFPFERFKSTREAYRTRAAALR